MGFVLLGAAIAALSTDPAIRSLAIIGATYQLVSHGLLTGGMFFLVGVLQDQAGTREIARLGGLLRRAPRLAFVAGLLALGSLGLPGFSGFVAEFQVIGATAGESAWAAAIALVGLLVTTGVYLVVLGSCWRQRRTEPLSCTRAHRGRSGSSVRSPPSPSLSGSRSRCSFRPSRPAYGTSSAEGSARKR